MHQNSIHTPRSAPASISPGIPALQSLSSWSDSALRGQLTLMEQRMIQNRLLPTHGTMAASASHLFPDTQIPIIEIAAFSNPIIVSTLGTGLSIDAEQSEYIPMHYDFTSPRLAFHHPEWNGFQQKLGFRLGARGWLIDQDPFIAEPDLIKAYEIPVYAPVTHHVYTHKGQVYQLAGESVRPSLWLMLEAKLANPITVNPGQTLILQPYCVLESRYTGPEFNDLPAPKLTVNFPSIGGHAGTSPLFRALDPNMVGPYSRPDLYGPALTLGQAATWPYYSWGGTQVIPPGDSDLAGYTFISDRGWPVIAY